MITHRTRRGSWELCTQASCELLFHFPDMTPAQMAAVPLEVLLPMVELAQPPSIVVEAYRKWMTPGHRAAHREYDLPAIISSDGARQWLLHGRLHRRFDAPASIRGDGTLEWYVRGVRHRARGPAVILPDGSQEWWHRGRQLNSPADTD